MAKPPIERSEWKRRRLRLDIALALIGFFIGYIIFLGNDTTIYQQAVIALIGAGVALIGQYVFGAAWDDNNYMKTVRDIEVSKNMRNDGYQDQCPPPPMDDQNESGDKG